MVKKIIRLTYISISVLFVIASCKSNIISKNTMADIIVEMHMADAIRDRVDVNFYQNRTDSLAVYGPIFAKYGYSIDDFNQSIKYYLENPLDFKEIYANVITRIKSKQEYYSKLLIEERKHKNLWRDSDSIYIETDTAYTKINFDIPVLGKGKYIFTADVKFFSDDSTANPRLNAWFTLKDKPDTLIGKKELKYGKMELSKITHELYVNDTLITNLKGYLVDYDSISFKKKQHIEIKNIYIEYVEGDGVDYTAKDTIPILPHKSKQLNKRVNPPIELKNNTEFKSK